MAYLTIEPNAVKPALQARVQFEPCRNDPDAHVAAVIFMLAKLLVELGIPPQTARQVTLPIHCPRMLLRTHAQIKVGQSE